MIQDGLGSTFWKIEPFLDQSSRRSFQILDDLSGGGVHCEMVMEGGGQIVLVNPEFVLTPYWSRIQSLQKGILESNVAPPSWGKGKIILLHKQGETSCPSNFRPIALSSTIGKLFHKILALRLEDFCLSNEIKGFSVWYKWHNGAHICIDGIDRSCKK